MSETMTCSRICKFLKRVLIWKLVVFLIIFLLRRSSIFSYDETSLIDVESSIMNTEEDIILIDDAVALEPASIELPWWDGGSCATSTTASSSVNTSSYNKLLKETKGYCGHRAASLGHGQKVLSYCLYGDFQRYASGLSSILETTRRLYPGWVVRVYTEPQHYKEQLCPLLDQYQHLYLCDVMNLPGSKVNLSTVEPRLWRVAPLGDELVNVFLSRDIDSELLHREAAAVAAFLRSGQTLHVMRDNPYHGVTILTGTFGISQTPDHRAALDAIRTSIFQWALKEKNVGRPTFDQYALEWFLYPHVRESSIVHDSYTCLKFPGSIPFPTQRVDGQFVGNRRYRSEYSQDAVWLQCPPECRPRGHHDWLYC